MKIALLTRKEVLSTSLKLAVLSAKAAANKIRNQKTSLNNEKAACQN